MKLGLSLSTIPRGRNLNDYSNFSKGSILYESINYGFVITANFFRNLEKYCKL